MMLIIIGFCLKLLHESNKDKVKYKDKIIKLQKDKQILECFFEEQSQKYDDFYVDYVNYKIFMNDK